MLGTIVTSHCDCAYESCARTTDFRTSRHLSKQRPPLIAPDPRRPEQPNTRSVNTAGLLGGVDHKPLLSGDSTVVLRCGKDTQNVLVGRLAHRTWMSRVAG